MIFKRKTNNLNELKETEEIIKYVKDLEDKINLLEQRIKKVEKESLKNFSKFSISRFNSFNDMGGDQSFTLALLDKEDNGFILTYLFHKDGVRLFTKPIIDGNSNYQLLDEEKIILRQAINGKGESKK